MVGIRSDCGRNKHHREHWTRKKGQWKPKKDFLSKEEGEEWINKYKMNGYVCYMCPECGNWHIGFYKEEV